MPLQVETLIVGGGQAGLAMSYHLRQLGREHLILERARIAQRWRAESWDSLTFQFPNWMIRLPGFVYEGDDPDAFMHKDGIVRFIGEYARRIAAPVQCGVRVVALDVEESRKRLLVRTDEVTLEAANVVVATGPYQRPFVPNLSANFPASIHQVSASHYANPEQLPPGRVLVVGSGGSGCQITEDLLQAGRDVYLSIGRHRRVPRRYRGKDFGWWIESTGALDRTSETLPADYRAPLLTGIAGGKDVDLRQLARRGVRLVGGLEDVQGERIGIAADVETRLAEGDESFEQFIHFADECALKNSWALEEAAPRPNRNTTTLGECCDIRQLNLRRAGIASIVWATGYRYDFGWIRCRVLDTHGRPIHQRGVSPVRGLYFLGLPRLHKVKSAFLWGVGEDAAFLAEHITARSHEC